jgi:hypothetical protein
MPSRRRLYTPPLYAVSIRRLYAPPLHAASIRRLYTPSLHAASTRRLYTLPLYAASIRRLYTPPLHAASTGLPYCRGASTAKGNRCSIASMHSTGWMQDAQHARCASIHSIPSVCLLSLTLLLYAPRVCTHALMPRVSWRVCARMPSGPIRDAFVCLLWLGAVDTTECVRHFEFLWLGAIDTRHGVMAR